MSYIKKLFSDREIYKIIIVYIAVLTGLLCLDYKDLFAEILSEYNTTLFIIICTGAVFLLLVFMLANHFQDMLFKVTTVNSIDRMLFFCFLSTPIYYGAILLMQQVYTYKIIVLTTVGLLSIIACSIRGIRYSRLLKRSLSIKSSVLDFKQVFEDIPKADNNSLILISEKDVDYDLFERQELIIQLRLALEICCRSEEPFVIGLSGEWGSGKTTILNNVKKELGGNERIIVIDDFDPWIYGSPKAILAEMYYTILKHTNVEYSFGQISELINAVGALVADSDKIGKVSSLAKAILAQDNEDSIETLKSKIDEYLKYKDITIVFFIDNLDRATAENVRFVFKLVGAVFDFKKVKYVLSYDKNRLSEIFNDSLQIDSRYMEKVINQELSIPKISETSREWVYNRSIKHLLLSYGVEEGQLHEYDFIIEFIIDEVKDIRKFKRLLNSAFFITFGYNNLYKPDLLALEIVRFLDIELYEAIYSNREFFIDADTQYSPQLRYKYFLRKGEFNAKCKDFLDSVFEGKDQYKSLLSNIFPYVDRYNKGFDIRQDESDQERYKDTQLKSRINSAKFFDLYFCHSLNDFLSVNMEFDNSMNKIFTLQDDKQIEDELTELIEGLPKEYHFEWTSRLYLNIEKIPNKTAFPILVALTHSIQIIDDTSGFFVISARRRTYGIMTELFIKLSREEKEEYLKKIKQDISKLYIITNMIFWTKEEESTEDRERLIACAKEISDKILRDTINVYDDQYYTADYIWSIYHSLKYSEVIDYEQIFKTFVAKILSSKNVYRVLRDTFSCSMGNGYTYSVNKDNFDALFEEGLNLQSFIEEHQPQNDSEQLVFDIYQDYLKYGNEARFYNERVFDKPYEFVL